MTDKTVKALKNYYTSYYNRNFLRDYRYIYSDKSEHKYNDILQEQSYNRWDNSNVKALNFLTTKRHRGSNGSFYYTLSYFKSLEDFHKGYDVLKYSDRLFFDFDIADDRVDGIKKQMQDVYKSSDAVDDKVDQLQQLKMKFQKLIFDDDLLYDVFVEASRLCDYLESIKLTPFLIFSGSKGFHINIFFDEMQLNQISRISYHLFKVYQQKLGLKYLDEVVNKDAIGRSQRVQYVYHPNTDLLTQPINRECSYDDVVDVIEHNTRKPISFCMSDYIAPAGFTKFLQKLNSKFSATSDIQQMNNNVKQQKKEEERSKLKFTDYSNEPLDIDMRELVRAYGIDGVDRGDRISIKCPFHNDNNPSAVVNSKGIYCSSCNKTFNYYDFIAEMESTTDKQEIMKIARKHSR
jgi:hypothetical protein